VTPQLHFRYATEARLLFENLSYLICCLPMADVPEGLSYQNLFRVIIMQFIDAYDFDVR
jgi:hypothetical protein